VAVVRSISSTHFDLVIFKVGAGVAFQFVGVLVGGGISGIHRRRRTTEQWDSREVRALGGRSEGCFVRR